MTSTTPPRNWMSTMGAKTKVMVLDSGLLPSPNLSVVEVRNCTAQRMEEGGQHGTDMCSIIASRDPLDLGVAPYCDLYVAKVVAPGRPVHWRGYVTALTWALALEVDVVNMSFATSAVPPEFSDLIRRLDERGTICCAAYSIHSWANKDSRIVTVGRMGPQSPARALAVGEVQRRGSEGRLRSVHGTSVSTAIMSGIAACAKSEEPDLTRAGFLVALASMHDQAG